MKMLTKRQEDALARHKKEEYSYQKAYGRDEKVDVKR